MTAPFKPRIEQLWAGGMSTLDIARELHCSEYYVYRVCNVLSGVHNAPEIADLAGDKAHLESIRRHGHGFPFYAETLIERAGL